MHKTLGTMIEEVIKYGSDMTSIVAQYQIFSVSGAGYYWPKAQRQRGMYFQGVHFQSIKDMFEEFDERTAKGEVFII
ncbi:uncharacterized protein A1O5_13263 [Cladophialophora psammophila CBS 110553]|uniref:Uncharacterized protein n=1 Tax=Cladophialophora psammophila CBS 110553 TaxID=1182543 RepID=W9VD00_9EURO|nr:uncharacterized protein A1O5_13263 [Cladophialophora psammophila CBS 110553]EXJ53487.1 hypothetical protein A1O5_13263 [Cladophialophora psammophila CBS 110553]